MCSGLTPVLFLAAPDQMIYLGIHLPLIYYFFWRSVLQLWVSSAKQCWAGVFCGMHQAIPETWCHIRVCGESVQLVMDLIKFIESLSL